VRVAVCHGRGIRVLGMVWRWCKGARAPPVAVVTDPVEAGIELGSICPRPPGAFKRPQSSPQ
jgi:hypothetical protein